jgi:hypothetical protein
MPRNCNAAAIPGQGSPPLILPKHQISNMPNPRLPARLLIRSKDEAAFHMAHQVLDLVGQRIDQNNGKYTLHDINDLANVWVWSKTGKIVHTSLVRAIWTTLKSCRECILAEDWIARYNLMQRIEIEVRKWGIKTLDDIPNDTDIP